MEKTDQTGLINNGGNLLDEVVRAIRRGEYSAARNMLDSMNVGQYARVGTNQAAMWWMLNGRLSLAEGNTGRAAYAHSNANAIFVSLGSEADQDLVTENMFHDLRVAIYRKAGFRKELYKEFMARSNSHRRRLQARIEMVSGPDGISVILLLDKAIAWR